MTDSRQHPPRAYRALNAATRHLIDTIGSQDAAAMFTRVERSTLAQYLSNEFPSSIPADVTADLEFVAGDLIVTRALAEVGGYVLIKKPPVAGTTDWMAHFAHITKEGGDVFSRIGEAVGDDGKISLDESHRLGLRKEIGEAIRALFEADAALEQLEEI